MQALASERANGSADIDRLLKAFLREREGARRFHAETIGDVNPHRCMADFLMRVGDDDRIGIEKTYRSSVSKASLDEMHGGITGGYLVPVELRHDLMMDVAGEAFFRPRACVVPMSTLTLTLPVPDAVSTPSAAGVAPFFGGFRDSPRKEGTTVIESEPAFKAVELNAFEIGGYALASNEMLADGGKPLDAWLRILFARSLSWYEDWFFTNGTGAGQPLGVINAPATLLVTRKTASHFDILDSQTMLSYFYQLRGGAGLGCGWLTTYRALADMTAFTGWIPNGPLVLHGMGVEPTTFQPKLGSNGDVMLVDPRFYVIGDRGEVEIGFAREEPTAWSKNQSVWRVLERLDGQPLLSGPIVLPDADLTTKVSPFVILH